MIQMLTTFKLLLFPFFHCTKLSTLCFLLIPSDPPFCKFLTKKGWHGLRTKQVNPWNSLFPKEAFIRNHPVGKFGSPKFEWLSFILGNCLDFYPSTEFTPTSVNLVFNVEPLSLWAEGCWKSGENVNIDSQLVCI